MKTKTKLILLGILSLLIGSAFATPLLITELEIVPFNVMPEGVKADFNINAEYVNITIQNDIINRDNELEASLDYYFVLNITNLSDVPAKLSNSFFAGAKNVTATPSALGGYHATNQDTTSYSSSSGPTNGYLGNVQGARVEALWLDGDLINTTWVPQGGLWEIWRSEDIFPPKELEGVWEPNWFQGDTNSPEPYITYGGGRSNDTGHYYHWGGRVSNIEGGNYWIEGVPLKEYIADNKVKATIIYLNGSWVDVTGRVELLKETPFVSATELLVQINNKFTGLKDDMSSITADSNAQSSVSFGFNSEYFYGFDNTWKAHESRLILLKGSITVSNLWNLDDLLEDKEITFYTALTNYVAENVVNGVQVNTVSTATELVTIELEIVGDSFFYNTILSDDQTFVTDSSGLEVFIVDGEGP